MFCLPYDVSTKHHAHEICIISVYFPMVLSLNRHQFVMVIRSRAWAGSWLSAISGSITTAWVTTQVSCGESWLSWKSLKLLRPVSICVSWAQNMPKMRLRPGLCTDPAGGAYSPHPDSIGWIKEPTSKWRAGHGRGGEGRERVIPVLLFPASIPGYFSFMLTSMQDCCLCYQLHSVIISLSFD